MKTAIALAATLAIAASSPTHAALTPYNVTYDAFTTKVFENFGKVAAIVIAHDDEWLLTTFDGVLADVEAQLALGQKTYPYYADQLDAFFQKAADHDDDFALEGAYEMFDLPYASLLGYAARPALDALFDTVEMALPTLKNATLSDWHVRERLVMEQRVLNGTSTGLLAGKVTEYFMELAKNKVAFTRYVEAQMDLWKQVQEAYEMPARDAEENDEEEDASQ